MTKHLALPVLFLFVLVHSLSSQHHFPKDSAEWKVYYERADGPVTYKVLRNHVYKGDTILIGNEYMKISSGFSSPFSGFKMSYIREVDTAQKVYILIDNGAGLSEYLLYDFSKSTGDTISIQVFPYGILDTVKWQVFNEGQITVGAQQRRYLDLKFIGHNPFQHGDSIYMDRWIEGIGSVRGLFAPMLDDGSIGIGESLRYHLVCFNDKGAGIQYEPNLLQDSTFYHTLLYTYFDSISNCSTAPWDNLSREEAVFRREPIIAYPNPFSEDFSIENPAANSSDYGLYTPDGQELIKGKIEPHETITIQAGHLPKGLYILKTTTENQVLTTKILRR